MIVQVRKKYKVITEKSVPMKTLDGITLFADVIRPDAAGRFPVLLSRTPYNKKGMDDPNGPNYLQQGANALRGDGTLSTVPPDKERADTYVYDPNAPVPSLGSNNLTIDIGVQDQRPVEERTDVLVYTSAPLEQPLEVTGPVTVTL